MGDAAVPADAARPGRDDLARIDESSVRCFDPAAEAAMVAAIKAAAKDGDSLGGVVEVLGFDVPMGLGSHVHWDRRIDGRLAQALMSIQAMKAVEIGEGAAVAAERGSAAHDEILWSDADGYTRGSDRAGGIEGGHDHRVAARGAGVDEAARHAEPSGAADRRRQHQGGDGLLQGADRRDRGAGRRRRGRDDGGARARRRGHPQVRWRLDARAHAQPPRVRRLL